MSLEAHRGSTDVRFLRCYRYQPPGTGRGRCHSSKRIFFFACPSIWRLRMLLLCLPFSVDVLAGQQLNFTISWPCKVQRRRQRRNALFLTITTSGTKVVFTLLFLTNFVRPSVCVCLIRYHRCYCCNYCCNAIFVASSDDDDEHAVILFVQHRAVVSIAAFLRFCFHWCSLRRFGALYSPFRRCRCTMHLFFFRCCGASVAERQWPLAAKCYPRDSGRRRYCCC